MMQPAHAKSSHSARPHPAGSHLDALLAQLPTALTASIFSFIDFRTTVCVLRLVCKACHEACNSPLAFRDQRVVLTSPVAIARWAPCLSLVKELDLQGGSVTEQALAALTPHVRAVQRLKLRLRPFGCIAPPDHVRVLTAFSNGFRCLHRLKIVFQSLVAYKTGHCRDDDTNLVFSFAHHFPHLTHLTFINNTRPATMLPAIHLPPTDTLTRLLPSVPNLCRLRWESKLSLQTITDGMLFALGKHCPRLERLALIPDSFEYEDISLTEASIRAFASGCPSLCSLSMHMWFGITSSDLDNILSSCRSLRHIDLRDCNLTTEEVDPILEEHPHITHLTFTMEAPFSSPHATRLTIFPFYGLSVTDFANALALNSNARHVTVRTTETAECSDTVTCADMAEVKRQHPKVKVLVWQRDGKRDACKTEARYSSGGTKGGDDEEEEEEEYEHWYRVYFS